MHRAGGVLQRERDGRRSNLAVHFALARLQRPTMRGS
jgi:hypothetical protein